MELFPASVEEKLGFDAVRQRLDDLTLGPLGQERVRQIEPQDDAEWVRAELERVGEYQDALRYDDAVPLRYVLDVREVFRQVAPEESYVQPEQLVAVRRVLVTERRVQRYFAQRERDFPHLHAVADGLTPLKDIEDHIADIVDEEGRVRDNASPELQRLRRQISNTQAELRQTLRRALSAARREGHAADDQPTLRSGRMVIPVRASAKRQVDGFVQDVSASGQTVYIEPAACLDLNNKLRELEAEARREVERILKEVANHLRAHLDVLRRNLRILARLDLIQAKAHLANELDAHVPHVSEENVVDVRKGRNPHLLLHFRRLADERDEEPRDVVPLDMTLGKDHRTLVITGPNAGGKTVALKTVGLFALMLACGLPLPAAPDTRLGLFGKLFVDIGDEQSIEEDLSTFSSHISNLKYMLDHADGHTLALIDEAGTGTDPAEGGALAQAILEGLTDAGARTIATTHHGTLKAFAHEHPRVENGSMEFDQETLRPTFRFQAGTPGSSYAFEIARRIGMRDETLERARTLVGEQKAALEDLISTFEQRTQELEQELREAQAAREQAETERETFEGRLRKLEKERDRIRQQALEQAEQIVEGANARIERTIREIKEAEAEREATKQAREELETYKEDLEEEVEEVHEKPSEAQHAPSAPEEEEAAETPAPIEGPIQEGDQVVIDDGGNEAEVLEIDDDEAVVMLGAMRMRVDTNRLTRVGTEREQQVTVSAPSSGAENSDLPSLSARPKVDLRGNRVEEARREVTRLLDEAMAADLHRVEILHGKGTGALREAIHELLADQPEVAEFEEAPWNEGGAGVTYVHLK